MWTHYRRFAAYNQIFIGVACVTAYYLLRMSLPAVAVMFVVMQAGALLGAWWSATRARQTRRSDERLPLERK
jgi:Flp pilus assembly protein TadB